MSSYDPEVSPRHLILVLGDQLTHDSEVFRGFDHSKDAIWMAENAEEVTYVWSHKLRIALFFSAMRHFRDELGTRGITVHYTEMPEDPSSDRGRSFEDILILDLQRLRPKKMILTQPGDYRVCRMLENAAERLRVALDVLEDRHFYCAVEEFKTWANKRKNLILEYFYREMRRKHAVLLLKTGEPVGGRWNFDSENRRPFPKDGPGDIPPPRRFPPDRITKGVIALIKRRFADHPGSLEHFDLPVTRAQAKNLLQDFIENRLPRFGTYEDAMWMEGPFLYHSRLSTSLNMKLLDPRECVSAAIEAFERDHAPVNSVEGFVRQIIAWREFIRGVYWLRMPEYVELNALVHELELPRFYWDGETDMTCLRQSMKMVIDYGYTHHIHRLMVLGLFALLYGVHPRRFHDWHMAMYLDAIDWVSLPNTLGMSQYADGGIVGSKPYCATGNYINRMSNFCRNCRYEPAKTLNDDACPFTTLYWDFLNRHKEKLSGNQRMTLQYRNLKNKDPQELREISVRADQLRGMMK